MLSVLLDSYYGIDRHIWAWGIGTAFALAALLISGALIVQTWRYCNYPPMRRNLILVLLMVPVYAVFAWLGLILKNQSQYWDLLRGCYEAVAIWAFYEFLVVYLGGRQHMSAIVEQKPRGKHLAPLCCLPGFNPHKHFYQYTRFCVLQYIPVQVVMSVVIFVTSLTGNYHDGHFAADDAYIYTAFIVNCSQIFALYGLLEFYQKLKDDLAPTRPFYKFLCIKLVVFFTFWQSVFLSMLVAVDVITPTVTYTTDQESYGIDDFVICIEMFLFAIAHYLAFPPREFENYTPPESVRGVTQEQGAKTGIDMDWMDLQMYQHSAKGWGVVDVGGKDKAAPADGWAYTKTESAATGGSGADSSNGAGGGEVQMTQLNGHTPNSHASTVQDGNDNVEVRVHQPAEHEHGATADTQQQHATAVPPPVPAGRPDAMEVTDMS